MTFNVSPPISRHPTRLWNSFRQARLAGLAVRPVSCLAWGTRFERVGLGSRVLGVPCAGVPCAGVPCVGVPSVGVPSVGVPSAGVPRVARAPLAGLLRNMAVAVRSWPPTLCPECVA